MGDGTITSIGGRALAALTLASCLPLDDLSHYSRGADPVEDAGLNFTSATPSLAPSANVGLPSRSSSGAPPEAEDDPGEPREPGPQPMLPERGADAGSPSGVPAGCLARLEIDAGVGSCYALSREAASWSAALAACAAWGGSLVSLNSASESDWLAATIDLTIWIGANDRGREGTFSWANGDAFVFELFAPGEPDNTFGVQDCVERRIDSSWNDRACSTPNPFVCEGPL
jgi:lectin-like protein